MQPVFDDQRGFVDRESGPPCGEAVQPRSYFGSDARVQDRVQRGALLRVGEDSLGQRLAIQFPGLAHHAGKARGHLREARRSRSDHVARDAVRIDDGDAELSEQLRDGALSRPDVPGEAEHAHRRTL